MTSGTLTLVDAMFQEAYICASVGSAVPRAAPSGALSARARDDARERVKAGRCVGRQVCTCLCNVCTCMCVCVCVRTHPSEVAHGHT